MAPLRVVGETRFPLERGDTSCYIKSLVIENLDTEILDSVPFMQRNDLFVRPAKSEIWIGDIQIRYGSSTTSRVRHVQVLRAPQHLTISWPDEYMELSMPDSENDKFAIDSLRFWLPGIVKSLYLR